MDSEAAPELFELLRDGGTGPRVEVDECGHGQQRRFQVVDDGEVASTLFDVAFDRVEDRQELALAIRAEPSQGACDRLDACDGVGVVAQWAKRLGHVRNGDGAGWG